MDPVAFKFMQLLLAEVLGAALCLAGVYLFIRGVRGRSNLLVSGAGLKAKLTNGAPGSIIALIGLAIVFVSLNSSVERVERSSDVSRILQSWLDHAAKVTDAMSFSQMTDVIVGTSPDTRFVSATVTPDTDTTIGDLARSRYGDARFWRLVAAINKDRGYFKLADAGPDTRIPGGKLVEVWRVSVYNGMDELTRTKVAGANVAAAYDELLARAAAGAPFIPGALIDEFQKREITFGYSEVNAGGARTLREVSLKYFGSAKYRPLLIWINPGVFPPGAGEDTNPEQGQGDHPRVASDWLAALTVMVSAGADRAHMVSCPSCSSAAHRARFRPDRTSA